MAFGTSTIVVVLSLVSLAALIIATITAPATSLSLARAEDIRYGALGYCFITDSSCVTGSPSYPVSSLTDLTDWKMDDSARDTLVKILIVTPVAAGLTLITLFFNLLLHFRAIGNSFAFCLITFIFALLAFFASAITVIVVFLLFYPHIEWPAWFLIASGVLSLINVPLAFFTLRTLPGGSSGDDEDEDDLDNKNLTDLTDGDNFKQNESFRLNDYPQPDFNRSRGAKSDYSAIKVITDDSSLSHDNEKVSIHDTSKAVNNGHRDYQTYAASTSNSALGSQTAYSDGTPHLVSSRDYNKGGAIRSEAPKFEAQSARPEFGATPYPASQYSSAPAPAPVQAPAPGIIPSVGPRSHSGSSIPLQQQQQQQHQQASSIGQGSVGLNSNVLPPSEHPSLNDDFNYDAEIINDDDSDFTSVSQRAANPNYYRSIQNQGPTLFPNQNQPSTPQSKPVYGQQAPSQHGGYAPQGYAPQGYAPQGYSQQGYAPQGYAPQQQSSPIPPKGPTKDTSSALLNANPDFAIGPASARAGPTRRSNPQIGGSYKPAYKRAHNGLSGGPIPAASLSNDSPYNFR